MKRLRRFDASKAVKTFYAGKKRKLPKYVGTDKESPTISQLDTARVISNKLVKS